MLSRLDFRNVDCQCGRQHSRSSVAEGPAQAPAPTRSYLFAAAICSAFSGDASKSALWSLLQK